MKALGALGLVSGVALLTVLVTHLGMGAILQTLETLGWPGFTWIVLFHVGLIALMGTAWFVLARGRADAVWGRFAWGRLVRDSAAEALPLSQIGGYVLGARAAVVAGVEGVFVASSTVVDVTVELVAQLGYILLGLFLLWRIRPGNDLIWPILFGIGMLGALAFLFIAVQVRGASFVDRALAQISRHLLNSPPSRDGVLRDAIHGMHRRPGVLWLAGLVHLLSWVLSGVETWMMLRLIGIRLGLAAGLVIDSLLYGVRSFAFMIPNAIGVQEAALLLLGALFGLGAEQAVALSLVRRGRDLAIGVPALLAWQVLEGRRAWRGLARFDPAAAAEPVPGRVKSGGV